MRLPTYFISHGAPNLVLNKNDPTLDFLKHLGSEIRNKYYTTGKLKAILVVSAHWEAPQFRVNSSPSPETIHDFYGFEPEMYQMRYPAKTSPELGARVCQLLQAEGIPCKQDPTRGYDHGCWSPLIAMFPDADIPVVQFALQDSLNPADHVAVGKVLQPLRDEGFLILGSGGATHNLRAMGAFDDNNQQFDKWLEESLTQHVGEERNARVQSVHKHPASKRAHPRIEHYLPVTVVAGAAGESKGTKIHDAWLMNSLSLAAYSFQ